MANQNNSVTVSLRLRDELSKGIDRVNAKIAGLDQTVDRSGKTATRTEKGFSRLGGSFSGLRRIASGFASAIRTAAFAVTGLLAAQGLLGTGLVKLAVNLVETNQKFSVLFGESIGAATGYVNRLHDQFGFFTGDIKDSLSLFAAYGQQSGITGQRLLDFSTNLQDISLDLSSFFNASLEETNRAVGAALRGEFDTIEKYGIILNEGLLQRKAAEMGLTGEIDARQKVLVRAALLEEAYNKSAARGDLLRTRLQPANQLRNFIGRLKELGATVGGILLAPLGAFLPKANEWLSRTEKRVTAWRDAVLDRIRTIGPALAANFKGGNLAGVASNLIDILGAPDVLKQPLEDILVLFREFGRIVKSDLIPAAQDIATVLVPALHAFRRFFELLPPGVVRALLEAVLAWKAISTVTTVVRGLTLAYRELFVAKTAAATAPEPTGAGGGGAGGGGKGGFFGIGPFGVASIFAGALMNFQDIAQLARKRDLKSLVNVGLNYTPAVLPKLADRFLGLGLNPFGDTGSPHRGSGYMGPYMQVGQHITSGYRTWGVGNDSDHAAGRAWDVIGPNLLSTAEAIKRNGGYAAMHGSGRGYHLHAVPAGDTATPRRAVAVGSGTSIGSLVVQVINPNREIDVQRAVQKGIEDHEAAKRRKGPHG